MSFRLSRHTPPVSGATFLAPPLYDLGLFLIRSGTANRGKSAESLSIACVIRVKGITAAPSEEGRGAGPGGTRSRLRGEMESGLNGERLGADGWTARGVYSDGPRRLTGWLGPSEVEIFPCGIYIEASSD